MAFPMENQRSFRLYVTHVDGEGHFLKISGQLDQPSSLMVETLFEAARENLEKGLGAVPPPAIQEGIICAAKYKDGSYYRAKIISTTNLSTGLVGVHFIDYGNRDIISLSTIRSLESYDPMFLQLSGQATDYYLSRIMHLSGRWDEPLLLKLQSLLCYADYIATVEAQTCSLPLISIQFKGNDLASHLVTNKFGVSISAAKQEVLLLQLTNENQQVTNWQPNFVIEPPSFTEHVPFLINQNFPSNPASAMRLPQGVAIPFNGAVPSPSLISQRLVVNKASRNPVALKAPVRQPQHVHAPSVLGSPPPIIPSNKPPSPKKSSTYKSRLLEVNTQHKVFVSYAEEGPELFAVQLVTDAKKLQDMMDEINKRPHSSLGEPPMIGTVCLGRMSGDRIICRAVVTNLSGSQCKLFFVDFGDTEMVSYYDIFDIPEEFVKPNVFAMRFCLSGVKKLEKSPHLNEAFKQLINGKVLTLKVVSPEGPPLIQYGELYLDNKNVLDMLMSNMKDKLQFRWIEKLTLGSRCSILVSYVDSCIRFYVQLSDQIDVLNSVMDAVKVHCENTNAPGALSIGSACCARFPDDGNWYRAIIKSVRGNKVIVDYVDYGNEQEVEVSDLRTITPELIRLPAQALKCALKGFENKPVETTISNQLEMLALEKTLMANVVGVLSSDAMLVTLIDDSASPPLDIAKRMMQLSTPRSSNVDPKSTTPTRRDAPESIGSPEGSISDDKKRNFKREKSFKDDRRQPREGNEDFGQRGGSFRGRENKEPFDRSGSGRHSEKFAGRPDKPERRGGGKPWENNANNAAPVPATGNDDWEETPATSQPSFQSPPNRQSRDNRDFRDRRKPRENQQDRPVQKPGWRKEGVANRLKQAAAELNDANKPSIQDRLKRDNKFNREDREENRNDDWGNKNRGRDNRGDRRDNRGDRRDNWGEKKENWGDKKDSCGDKKDNWQKRDFKDNRGDKGDRQKSNFSPRERAERSFGSDSDKKSDRSFRSQESRGERSGRAPPFKSRSKFTQVQYKELPDPVSLETPFTEPSVEAGTQHEVSVTWIISPSSFYTQIMSHQPNFLEMMHKIPELYKGVKSFTGIVPVGGSVLARYPVDGVLYRATVISVQPFSKFIVQYIDFGNKQLVDSKDIWQLDRQLLELPKMAVHCSLVGVAPIEGEWKANPEIDLCFNGPRYQCVFQDLVEDRYNVSLWNNSLSVADTLVEKQLAVLSEKQSSVTLKDEAIDLTIIVGQQILAKVTHVESYKKFYVQLDLEKAALVEIAIENYDSSLLTPLAADSLTDGVHCTVKHEGKICRAIINDASDVTNIKAVLPDYGLQITTKTENLMILPTELTVYYYQSLECCLNNYTAESKTLMSIEDMKKQLTNNKVIVYVNRVEEITLVTTLYDPITGKKLSIFEPDEDAYEEVVQLCQRAVYNYNFGMAYISHAQNLNEIYLQKATDSERIAQLLDNLYKMYEEGTPEALDSFEVDGMCAAKSSDGNWYRAMIVSAEETTVNVQFSDYGNTEIVQKDTLKKLDPKFYEPNALALVVSLGLVGLREDAVSQLVEWTTDKEIQVTLAFGTDGWLASLHLDGVDLSMKLVTEKLATPKIATPDEVKTEVPIEEAISLPAGCMQVYISHIDSPGHFWLQMSDKVDLIEEIQANLQLNVKSYQNLENPETGSLCVAKYSADDQWYRAEILDSDTDIITVRFIDYGNTDVLDNQPGLLKVIPDSLKETESYAIKSSVNAVPTGTGQWSEAASDYFTQLVGDLANPVDALVVLKDVTTYVDIFVNGQNITDKLVSDGHATRSEETECGDLPSCFASHVNSPSEFWIQLETATPELQSMENAMVDAENFPELPDKEEGVICAAKYPEDGAWYRAQVIVDGSEGTEVLFMDYGNASIATELRSLPDELKVKPALSRKCAMQKPRDIKWSRKSEIKFNDLAAEGATIFNVQFIASGDISIVELYLEGKSVTEELVALCEEHPATERPSPVGQDLKASGKISYVTSVQEVYLQLDDSAAELDKVTEELLSASDFEPTAELRVGSICAAFWIEDEQWYRAKILEFCDVGYHVQFLDYGNKSKCEVFKQLPKELALIEPLAKCCCLTGFGDDNAIDESAKVKLNELAEDENATFQIEFLDSTKEPALVRLTLNGNDVGTLLQQSIPVEETSLNTEIKDTVEETSLNTETKDTVKETSLNTEIKDTVEGTSLHTEIKDTVKETSLNTEIKDAVEETSLNTEIKDTVKETSLNTEIKDKVEETLLHTEITDNEIENNATLDEELNDLNKSQDLDESFESSHTVIENKSFDGDVEYEDAVSDVNDETLQLPKKDLSSETLDSSNDTLKSLEGNNSKESINTDTGYISGVEKSPNQDPASPENECKKSDKSEKEKTPVPVTDEKSQETDKNATEVPKEKETECTEKLESKVPEQKVLETSDSDDKTKIVTPQESPKKIPVSETSSEKPESDAKVE